MEESFRRSIRAGDARELTGGIFAFVAKTILTFTFVLMSIICGVYLAADSAEEFGVDLPAPGDRFFQIASNGIYAITSRGGVAVDCSLTRAGEPVRLYEPKEVWYGAVSGSDVAYLANLNVTGAYKLECKSQAGSAPLRVIKGFYENAVWIMAWLLALPMAVMGGVLLAGWIFIQRAMPGGDYTIGPTGPQE